MFLTEMPEDDARGAVVYDTLLGFGETYVESPTYARMFLTRGSLMSSTECVALY